MSRLGDAVLVLRRAADITQEDLADRLGITQAALSRYENDLREPDAEMVKRLADALGVTPEFLSHDFRMRGALAADAHMRRQKTAKPSDWKRAEARLNALRMHSAFLFERLPLRAENHVPTVDPADVRPAEAAALVRANWKMPIGPVRDLTGWIEAAGVIVVEEDFSTHRIDGMSQWAAEHPVIAVNESLPTDRKRLTLAHELGHLVMHSNYADVDMEAEANEFAAEFLMPAHLIASEFHDLSLGRLLDLKLEWGVSAQALYERAYRMGRASATERQSFYRQVSSRGWRTREPNSDLLPEERPRLATSVGDRLRSEGLADREVARLTGILPDAGTNPFARSRARLRAV